MMEKKDADCAVEVERERQVKRWVLTKYKLTIFGIQIINYERTFSRKQEEKHERDQR